jgi:hypothetical protein
MIRANQGSSLLAIGPPAKHENVGGAGAIAPHSTGLMVRRTHPTLDFGGTGFQPVHRHDKIPAPLTTLSGQLLMGILPTRKTRKVHVSHCS